MDVVAPMQLKPGHYPTDVALRTVSEAIAKAGSQMLEIEPGELMAEYCPSLTAEGRNGLKAEIFLYDTLADGADFSSQLVERGTELFQRPLQLMNACPEDCDASCYRCLRSFKNKFEHILLDRYVGAELWNIYSRDNGRNSIRRDCRNRRHGFPATCGGKGRLGSRTKTGLAFR